MEALEWRIDYLGRRVEFTEESWEHILDDHPEMADRRAEIAAAITSPTVVARGPTIHRVEQHYGASVDGVRARVIVPYRPTSARRIGETRTAHRTARIEKGERLWP